MVDETNKHTMKNGTNDCINEKTDKKMDEYRDNFSSGRCACSGDRETQNGLPRIEDG